MRIENRYLSILYKLILIFLAGWGLSLQLGLDQGQLHLSSLIYYTLQSNLLCFIFLIVTVIHLCRHLHDGKHSFSYAPRFKGALVVCIMITFLIYHFLLRPSFFSMDDGSRIFSISNLLLHYIVPLMFFGDWLLFDRKGRIRKTDPFLWLFIPLAYFIFAVIRAQIGGGMPYGTNRYPYFFIDIDALGVGQVLLNVLAVGISVLILGYILYALDFFLFKMCRKSLDDSYFL